MYWGPKVPYTISSFSTTGAAASSLSIHKLEIRSRYEAQRYCTSLERECVSSSLFRLPNAIDPFPEDCEKSRDLSRWSGIFPSLDPTLKLLTLVLSIGCLPMIQRNGYCTDVEQRLRGILGGTL